jgi:hypothetical protein
MRRDFEPSSRLGASHHRPSSADFIINTGGFEFSVQTGLTGPSSHSFQSSLLVHSARGIFLPPQHRQPGPWPDIDENPLLSVVLPPVMAAAPLEIIGVLTEARGDSAPQSGQTAGNSYSAIGRKSENEPQRGQL